MFVYFYKTSGKFRQSIIAAFVAVTFYFSDLKPAHSAGQADAFTPQNQQHQSRPQNQGIFSRKSNNDGPGPGKPNGNGSGGNDDSVPKYPQPESVEKTQERVDRITEQTRRLKEVTETDDESEKQCSIEEIKDGIAKDGTFIHASASQVRDKGLHIPDFLDEETLDGKFDVTQAETLEYSDRLKYLRDKNNLPDEIVSQARDKILDFMTADDTMLIPGCLGHNKIEGTVFINTRLNKVGFRDSSSYKFRTAMTMNDEKILKLAKNGFHLFPNAGKP